MAVLSVDSELQIKLGLPLAFGWNILVDFILFSFGNGYINLQSLAN